MPARNRSKRALQRSSVEALENRWLLTAATLVSDLNTAPGYGSFSNQISFGGKLYFTSRQDATGQELYSTDGTHTGIVADVNPGPAGSDPRELTISGGLLYFTADDGGHGRELWKTDGTAAGTALVYDADPGPVGSDPFALADVNGTLFFEAFTPTGLALFKTTGSPAGTALVSPLHYADREFAPTTGAAVAGGRYFFQGYDPQHGYELWVSDGSPAGTQVVSDLTAGLGSSTLSELTAAGAMVYFVRNGHELWASDGTSAGTTLVKTFSAAPTGNSVHELVGYGNLLAFRAPDGTTTGVWRTDGTAAGTFVLGNDAQAPDLSDTISGPDLVASGGTLFFTNLRDLVFRSDGSASGTAVAYNAGSSSGFYGTVGDLLAVNGSVALVAKPLYAVIPQPPPRPPEVIFGNLQIVSILPGGAAQLGGSNPSALAGVGNAVYFVSSTAQPFAQDQLWAVLANGSGQPGHVATLEAGTRGASLSALGTLGGSFLFGQSLTDGALAPGLYRTDGTVAGTTLVKSIPYPYGFYGGTVVGGGVYFDDPDLWQTNGTPAATTDLGPGTRFPPVAFKGRVVLPYTDDTAILGVRSFGIGSDVSPVVSNDSLYIFGDSGVYRTDGIAAAVQIASSAAFLDAAASGGKVFWGARDLFDPEANSTEAGLYVTDGTAAGTSLLHTFHGTAQKWGTIGGMTDVSGTLFFWAYDQTAGLSIWKSDGTAAGTVKLAALPQGSGSSFVQPQQRVAAGDHYFFTALDPTDPIRLTMWGSDGTAAGTMPLIEDVPGRPTPTWFLSMANVNGVLYFGDKQLWRSDGTPAGTYPVSPVGSLTTRPTSSLVAPSGSNLYFSADDVVHGLELYSLPVDYVPPLAQILPPNQGADNGPVDQITIRFNRAVDNLQVRDLLLSHGGTANVLSGSETLTTSDHVTWTLGNLLPDTFATGSYTLSLVPGAGDVMDAQSDPVANYARQTFTVAPAHLVAGEIFNDANHNGVRDTGEAGLAGWTVYLDTNGSLDGHGDPTAVTDADGRYVFTNAPTGTYVVREVVPSGWRRTTPIASAASVAVDSDQQSYGPIFGDVQVSTVPLDFNYLLTLAQHYGQAGTFATGDVTGDDHVDFNDLLLLAQNYNHPLPAQGAAAASQPVATQDLPLPRHKLRPGNTIVASIPALH